MFPLNGLTIGGWCGYGCVLMLEAIPPPYPPGCVGLWRGYMIITQGGTPYYGQWTPVEVACNGAVYLVTRDCGAGVIQTAALGNPQNVVLGGAPYLQIAGPSNGPGTGGAACEILALQAS